MKIESSENENIEIFNPFFFKSISTLDTNEFEKIALKLIIPLIENHLNSKISINKFLEKDENKDKTKKNDNNDKIDNVTLLKLNKEIENLKLTNLKLEVYIKEKDTTIQYNNDQINKNLDVIKQREEVLENRFYTINDLTSKIHQLEEFNKNNEENIKVLKSKVDMQESLIKSKDDIIYQYTVVISQKEEIIKEHE